MKNPQNKENGIIAILDALGAANYGETEIARFVDSRQQVLELLDEKASNVFGKIDAGMVTTFTFNDTILIVLRTGLTPPKLQEIGKFFSIMRKFFVDSLEHGILFRGSIAVGDFYVNDKTNTVLGKAITDAAAWYDKADWIGIHATPRTSMVIQRWIENSLSIKKENVLIDYDVPMKHGGAVRLKAVNWPKMFFNNSYSPCKNDEEPREKLLQFLTIHQVPAGTESKFFNTVSFFDHAAKQFSGSRKPKKAN